MMYISNVLKDTEYSINMYKFDRKEWRIFCRLQRKHKVSMEFLRYNLANIEKIIWYETSPRIIIKRYAVRKRNRIFLVHYRLRRVLFDQTNRKIVQRMKQNVRQWSKRIVAYQRRTQLPKEFIEETVCDDKPASGVADVSRQLKEQLELLKSGRRQQSLINAKQKGYGAVSVAKEHLTESDKHPEMCPSKKDSPEDCNPIAENKSNGSLAKHTFVEEEESFRSRQDLQNRLESTPEKQVNIVQENSRPIKQLATDEKTEKSQHEDEISDTRKNPEKNIKTGVNFLDMLISKVGSGSNNSSIQTTSKTTESKTQKSPSDDVYHQHEHSLDSSDGFLGFDDNERIPGMLMTPIVPNSTRNNKNSIFVSETLNEYMRQNDLETNYNIDEDKSIRRSQVRPTDLEGLMTPKTQPPEFDMPAVPDNLLRFRTVAERRNYLQKFAKNSRLSIINNEASIYRELQKRIRFQKCKPSSQQISAQSAGSAMSFSRNGWCAASFINTEFNKYYYQMLDVDNGKYRVKLKGVRGNNDEFRKKPYTSIAQHPLRECPPLCIDEEMWHDFKSIKTVSPRAKKLNKGSLPSVFKPCPLSHKTLQKPLDDDAAALLLAGGSMAVVRMPTVELEVFPECGRPLNEIAKRYLQYILPHHDISREWAEFSVSTLKSPESLKDAVKAATNRKSFTFVIPYLNDRNHVLVRRVVDRSEKLDQSFEQSSDTELVPKADFTFRQNLDMSDDILVTCADVVSDMINSVAISCSENSFIKTDPDMQNEGNTESVLNAPSSIKNEKVSRPPSAASNSEAKKQSKQKRVLSELKRLNATIIDAAVKTEKEKKPCSREFCTMGCICDSLEEDSHVREHCGKTKCMWDCTCKSLNQSRIMRLETDGRTITTEDAFMLRRKATARLARMEKEFTSTVVLTENETLLINETNNDKKRRCTKAPKRYEYYEDETDEEARKQSPKKTALTTIDNEKHLAVDIKEFREPVYIQDTILEQLKHCTVNLVRLENMDNVAPWCMIHNLYKCFCKGRSLEGKPMVIEKDENNTTIEHGEDEPQWEIDYKISTKARYTFEKVEKKKYTDGEESDDNDINTKLEATPPSRRNKERPRINKEEAVKTTRIPAEDGEKSENELLEPASEQEALLEEQSRTERERPRRSIEDVRERFYASRPECCRRQIPIPRRMFLYCNRKRRLNVLKYIKENETEKNRLLLNEHVMRSVYYHKADNEKTRKQQESKLTVVKGRDEEKPQEVKSILLAPRADEKTNKTLLECHTKDEKKFSDENKQQVQAFVNLLDDDEDDTKDKKLYTKDETNKTDAAHDSVITVKAFGTLSSMNIGESKFSSTSNDIMANEDRQEPVMPKISNCFSLNAKANTCKALGSPSDVQRLQQHLADLTSATSVNSQAFNETDHSNAPQETMAMHANHGPTALGNQMPGNVDADNLRDVYNSVIRTMNTLVSKKMQDVDFALKRESHIIPSPNADILCIMKWSNFLDAYCQGFAFIWQVKSKEGTYLVATIRNMMPMVCEAMGVVNITALKPERVPLMGRMLLQNVRNEKTTKLAVVMQGKPTYWVVKGFLKADPSMACNKPTPETHPTLTKKINVLCTSLVKQRQKEEKKREQLAHKRNTATSISPQVSQIITPLTDAVPNHIITFPQIVTQNLTTIPPPPYQVQQMQILLPTNPVIAAPQPPPPYPIQQQPTVVPQIPNPSVQASPVPPATLPANTTNTMQISNSPQNNPRKRKATIDMASNDISPKMEAYSKMSSNIEFRKVTPCDIDEIHLPEVHKNNHKWLVLDLHNDFSHIFVPEFRDLVSLDRIQKVINFAKQKHKIVKLQFFKNAPFDAFVTPKSGKKIYFGPLNMDMKAPTLILLQSVDGVMMLREMYQVKHNIQKSLEERTKAFWLLQMNGQTHFEIETSKLNELESSTLLANNNTSSDIMVQNEDDNDDDEDDCMIIDDVSASAAKVPEAPSVQQLQEKPQVGRYNFTIASANNDSDISIISQSNSLPGPPPIQTLSNSRSTPTNGLQATGIKIPHTNTIIKPLVQIPMVVTTTSQQSSQLSSAIGMAAVVGGTNSTSSFFASNNVPITTAASQNAICSSTFMSQSPVPSTLPTASQTLLSPPPAPSPSAVTSVNLTNQSLISPNIANMPSETHAPSAQKRRRVSVVCRDSYDRTTQNIAVNAVINKILPDNIQDIQVNQTLGTLKAVSTIGSTTITKILDSSHDALHKQQPQQQLSNKEDNVNVAKPLVFDVSFVDGGEDEPAASIVIKPTAAPPIKVTPTPAPPTSVSSATTSNLNSAQRVKNPKFLVKSSNNAPYKFVKLGSSMPNSNPVAGKPPQIYNKLPTIKTSTSTSTSTNTSNVKIAVNSQSNNTLPKKVLNTINPIKITNITTIPASKMAPAKLLTTPTTSNIKIAPKPLVQTAKTLPMVARSVTITPLASSATSSVANSSTSAAPTAVTYTRKTLPTSQPLTPASSATSTVTSNNRLISSSCSSNLNNSSISGLAITSVKSFGATPSQRINQNTGISVRPSAPLVVGQHNKNNEVGSVGAKLLTSPTGKPPNIQLNNNRFQVGGKTMSGLASTSSQQKKNNEDNPSESSVALPRHIQYGYIISSKYTDYKFVAKRVLEEFYVKVPSVGILKLMGLTAVQNYLNKHMQKISQRNTLPGDWKFMAASKEVQLQNHQKSLLVRKSKSGTDLKLSTRAPILNSTRTDSNKSQKVVSVTSMSETILIDD
ncbi:uncharacterized protein LOC106085642 isoform X1 [Stomoxys calcitrans]|uniref:uncharacterized protein LOC106085642 isoform X1 n=2 Tax=Stomoxys calcitrans TaxID=35570 RepID=UPI0027E2D1A8|nr:uncharacterized protein LOC106085642 isoform X1 [Stomoxys calcitrans]